MIFGKGERPARADGLVGLRLRLKICKLSRKRPFSKRPKSAPIYIQVHDRPARGSCKQALQSAAAHVVPDISCFAWYGARGRHGGPGEGILCVFVRLIALTL